MQWTRTCTPQPPRADGPISAPYDQTVTEVNPLDYVSALELWDAAADGLVLVDHDGIIVAANTAFLQLFGYRHQPLVGLRIETLVPPNFRTGHDSDRRAYGNDPTARPMNASAHLQGLRADGSTFYVNVSLAPIETAHGQLTLASARDQSQSVAREAELSRVNQLRALAEDHDRIASELHDSTIQRLFALGLGLQGLPAQITDEQISAKVNAAVDTLDDVILEIRNTIHGLRHVPDPAITLAQRVVALVGEMESVLGFVPEIRFSGDINSVKDESVIGHLLPVLREGLSNIARHAEATEAIIRLSVNDTVTLEVSDNGHGIKDNVVRSGLANIADRAVALSGSFTVQSAEPVGTQLRWSVPTP